MDAYERDREANALGQDVCDFCEREPCICWEWDADDLDIDEEIAKAKRLVERALFVNGGLRNFLTIRRGA